MGMGMGGTLMPSRLTHCCPTVEGSVACLGYGPLDKARAAYWANLWCDPGPGHRSGHLWSVRNTGVPMRCAPCPQASLKLLAGTNGPQEKFAVLRHAAACRRWGYPNFPKATKVANPRSKQKRMHLPTPCKHEHIRITSWVVILLLLLLMFPLFVHFFGIHDCQTPQHLIAHIETVMLGCVPTI